MDVPPTWILRGVGFGLREGYRAARVQHWKSYDRSHADGTGWVLQPDGTYLGTGRNAPGGPRDTLIREWGKSGVSWTRQGAWRARRWMGGPLAPLPSDVLKAQWRSGKDFNTMEAHPLAELQLYNEYAVEEGIYIPAGNFIQKVRAEGPNGEHARFYDRITSPVAAVMIAAEQAIINLFVQNWHRFEQMKHFMYKIHYEKKMAKKLERASAGTLLVQIEQKVIGDLSKDTMPKVSEFWMKLMRGLGLS